MKNIITAFLVVLLLFTIYYLLLPSPVFPPFPPGSLTSTEPADTESIYRQAFFTDLDRIELISYFTSQFSSPVTPLRLNYPPEEAYSLIRDQTRSSWMEELVHPWRDSLLINGFYPTLPTEQINRNGVHYQGKITIRRLPSHALTRLTVLALTCIAGRLLVKEYAHL
ncbi:hypothetical protein A3H89_02525 [Candidatus Amesbacteria bacterium RIFCSPLOWO2_02_FULL_48_11]|uniref:Uncharacterized protein n=3 Tax=Candidatus Amesiibacteriota TaxID=1752730 RepID=A0A1F4ZB08_9BACT|nr:MAG: hypothetical protein UY22_C0030G0004 [Candidatus Amesbacteria bacterium GW2011_GWC1_48_10]KKU99771.1 MAG: hypothetical protein UY33_C0023G0005 [Candidatus Amesbacteria bacterium GW2011_GWA1_48_9]OGC90557.1 MAG: hypothetical protein A2V48_01020 [Candidatus Amesbacteria bacterium RBG_19FT_COMBO_48_16]OGC96812.1 MAG: hypothetical protein A3C34_00510 [Candidatus Amesbacteria bacterium RIFCSPHIGHO2_02_FULL_48_21]OGC97686.1 MAG: hypothetical protein A2W16_01545 [Candidatus Amesbacteria bacter